MKIKPFIGVTPLVVVLLVHLFDSRDAHLEGREQINQAVQILSTSSSGATLVITPQAWTVRTTTLDGAEFVRLDFRGAAFEGDFGEPQIPYHKIVMGIPVGATVRYEIVEIQEEVLHGLRPLPSPTPGRSEGLLQELYKVDETIYNQEAPFPQEIVDVQTSAFFREQQVAQIAIAGLRYLPSENQIVKYNRIVVRLEFSGGLAAERIQDVSSRSEEERYKGLILNYEQARKWRTRSDPVRDLRKGFGISASTVLYKFRLSEEGIYRIDGDFLASVANLNLADIEPSEIRLFNNGGLELPRNMSSERPAGLVENAIRVVGGDDGTFDADDYILFYGRGVDGWRYSPQSGDFTHYINHYVSENVYWLSFDGGANGLRMEEVSAGPASGAVISEYRGLEYLEENLNNPLGSGLNWFGRQFSVTEFGREQSYTFDLPNAQNQGDVQVKHQLVAKNAGSHSFAFSLNDGQFVTRTFSGQSLAFGEYLQMQVRSYTESVSGQLRSGSNQLTISYSHAASNGEAYLDWLELSYRADLNAVDDELAFYVFPGSGLLGYEVGNFGSNTIELFEVTDYSKVKLLVNPSINSGRVRFADFQTPDNPKRYIALSVDKYKTVEVVERHDIRDLRGETLSPEFIIITHDEFLPAAQQLETLRENASPKNRLDTEVVVISDIFDSFSGGLFDPTAIRDFLRFAYVNWRDPVTLQAPGYVLLIGDGDYDYKNILNRVNNDWIPTFQTDDLEESLLVQELVSRTTDSWYTYVSGDDALMDMAIGRINAQSLSEAQNVVEKIRNYEINPERGNWRNTITMVGDDALIGGGVASSADRRHISDAETLVDQHIPASFEVEKIYLTEFPEVISASVSGVLKPAATEALIQQLNKGTLIVNFIGHGNSELWAHERVFQRADNDRIQNAGRTAFFVAATCDWALFDNPQAQSQAEELLLLEDRGAISILSSARLVFAGRNARFNQNYFDFLFQSSGETSRIGDAMVFARSRGERVNGEKFHIYGDPTLKLAIPERQGTITSMEPDSIVALTTIELTGEVLDGVARDETFNGTAFVTAFDSRKNVRHLGEAGVQLYSLPGNSIYRGTVSVHNGAFASKFVVPKDISYGGSQARISVYFWNDESDGVGGRDAIRVSGTTRDLRDAVGPEITLYFEGHENFTTGDIIEEDVVLVAEISDSPSGINIAGEIGHRITLTIDPDEETCLSQLNQFNGISSIDLTDLFRFDEGDHLGGRIEFPVRFPDEVDIGGTIIACVDDSGEDRHTLLLKAWDNSNNSTTASIEVLVSHEDGLVLREVMNYPNPFQESTTFTFFSNRDIEAQIKIYTVAGLLIRTLEYSGGRDGFNMVPWDGLDEIGDIIANGVYLYKLIGRSTDLDRPVQTEVVGRLAVVR